MTNQRFAVNHAADAAFERGLRPFFEYRDLGITQATGGQVVAHVIRAVPGAGFSSQAHQPIFTPQSVQHHHRRTCT